MTLFILDLILIIKLAPYLIFLYVIPPKPGKDHFNPLNYRPIALTSCICKTVERMVNERLVWYLEKNGLLAKQQCGYRSNRSTVDHLVRLETFIRDVLSTINT